MELLKTIFLEMLKIRLKKATELRRRSFKWKMICGITKISLDNYKKPEYFYSGFFIMNVDYIIVGDGYAGLFFAHQLIRNNKTFVMFSEGQKSASQVSAGIINLLCLKNSRLFGKHRNKSIFLKVL
jgi:hypothetical protein